MTELEDYLEKRRGEEIHSEILDFFFKVRNFLSIYERLDDHYVIYTELEENGRFKLKLACMNPAENLQEYLDMGNSTIFFSATFLPIHYYKKLLSTGTDDYAIYIRSSFPVQNRRILLGMDVTTKYTMRGMDMYEKYASYLLKITAEKRGNYLAVSYTHLDVYKRQAIISLKHRNCCRKNIRILISGWIRNVTGRCVIWMYFRWRLTGRIFQNF